MRTGKRLHIPSRAGALFAALAVLLLLAASWLPLRAQVQMKQEIHILAQVIAKYSKTLKLDSEFEMVIEDLTFLREYFPSSTHGVVPLSVKGTFVYTNPERFDVKFRFPGVSDVGFFSNTGYDLNAPAASSPSNLPSSEGTYANHPLTLLFPFPLRKLEPGATQTLQGDEIFYGKDCYSMRVMNPDGFEMTLLIDKAEYTIARITFNEPRSGKKTEGIYRRYYRLQNGTPMFTECEVTSVGRTIFTTTFINPVSTSRPTETITTAVPGTTKQPPPPEDDQGPPPLLSIPLWILVILLAAALSYYLFRYLRFVIARPVFSRDLIVIEEENSKLSILLRAMGFKVHPFGPDILSDERKLLGRKPGINLPKAVIVARNAFGESKSYFFLIKAYMEEGGRVLVLSHSPQSSLNMPFNPHFIPFTPSESSVVFTVKGPSIWKRITQEELQEAASQLCTRQFYMTVNEQKLDVEIISAADRTTGARSCVVGIHKEGRGEYILCQLNVETYQRLGTPEALQTPELRIFMDIIDFLQGREKEPVKPLEENITESINLYRRLLEVDSRNIEAHHQLADLYAKQGNREKQLEEKIYLANHYTRTDKYERALALLDDILQVREDHEGALTLQVEIHLKQKLTEKALKEAGSLCESFLLAERYDEALSLYEHMLRYLPDSEEVHRQLLRIHERRNDSEKALDEKLFLAEHYVKAGDHERGRKYLDDVLKMRPDDSAAKMLLLSLHIASNKNEDALAEARSLRETLLKVENYQSILDVYLRLKEFTPKDIEVANKLIETYGKMGRSEEMVEEQLRLASLYDEQGELEKCTGVLETVVQDNPGYIEARTLLFTTLLRRNLIDRATEEARVISEAHISEEKHDEAIAIYRALQEKAPGNAEVQLRIIASIERKGDRESLLNEKLALASLYENASDLERCTSVLEEVKAGWPDLKATRMRLFDLFLQRGLIDKATAEADFLAEFYLKERIFDRAADLYMKIREKTPDNIDLRRRLIDIYEKQGDREKILDEKSAVAEIVERSGDLEKAAAIFTEIREGWPEDKACRIRLINLHIQRNLVDEALEETGALYKLLVKEEKYDEAISLYRIILNISPDNMEARQRLLQLYHLTGDEDKVVEELMYLAGYFARTDELEKSHMILDRILAEKHDHFEARVALIGLYLKQNEMAKAEEEVRTLAGIFLDGKGYKDAIEIRNRLVNLAADNLEWRDMLFQYLLLGRESE